MLRVLREWVLARSAPSSPLARVCALHLLCRDAGFLHDAGRDDGDGWVVCARCCCLRLCVCACLASVFGPVPRPQARLRVPMRCICWAGMLCFCRMPGCYFADWAVSHGVCRMRCVQVTTFGSILGSLPHVAGRSVPASAQEEGHRNFLRSGFCSVCCHRTHNRPSIVREGKASSSSSSCVTSFGELGSRRVYVERLLQAHKGSSSCRTVTQQKCSFGVAPQSLIPFVDLLYGYISISYPYVGVCSFPAVPGYLLGMLNSPATFSCGGWVSRYLDHRLGTFAR